MNILSIEQRKRPIGDLPLADHYSEDYIQECIQYIKSYGTLIERFYNEITEADYQKEYRPGSWTIQELIHHIAESHMIHFTRIKLCLSVEHPTVNPFPENIWVDQSDVQDIDPYSSILILKGIHERLGHLLSTIDSNKRKSTTLYNPEPDRNFNIEDLIVINAWHGKHHLSQLNIAFKNPA